MSNRMALWHPCPDSTGTVRVTPSHVRNSRLVFGATLGVALLLLLLLELRSPYYFLQDDGINYFLPMYFHNWRSLLSGHLPLYDFHIFAGLPHIAMGQTAVFYPPQYLAMFLSELFWGHPFATIDLLAFMHGLIAVAGGYVLLQYLGATDMAAAFGALTAFSGFFVWAGRMWPFVPMLCAWFPWMVWAALRYLEKPNAGRAGWLIFFRLGLLYGGYPQYFVLAMIFEHLFVLTHSLVVRVAGWRSRCAGYLALDVVTALLGLPFLLPVWAAVERSMQRASALSYAEFSSTSISPRLWVFGQLFVFAQQPRGVSVPYLSYVGYVASVLSLGAVDLWSRRPRSRQWIVAAGVCFLLSFLWFSNIIGSLLFHLPVLSRFRWPCKLVYFAGFSQCLVAALVLTLFSRRWQRIAIAAFVANWIVVFCFLPNHAWRVRKYHSPLKSPWTENLMNGRYLAISGSPISSHSKEFVQWDYSTLWGTDDLLGYEPLVPLLNGTKLLGRPLSNFETYGGNVMGPVDARLLSYLKRWSVRYVLVGPGRPNASRKLRGVGFEEEAVKDGWTLWKDPNALPRVRWGDIGAGLPPGAGIRWVEHVNSIGVHLSQWPGNQLVMAFAANPGLEACVTGRCNPVAKSSSGLIRIKVPRGTRHIRLVYHNSLLLPSALVALATLLVYLLLLFRSVKAKQGLVSAPAPGRNPLMGPE